MDTDERELRPMLLKAMNGTDISDKILSAALDKGWKKEDLARACQVILIFCKS